jgi:hypothetical protein
MIRIRESFANKNILEKHTYFVEKEIVGRIEFYTCIFKLIGEIQTKVVKKNELKIHFASLMKNNNKRNIYKYLINGIYTKSAFKSIMDLPKLSDFKLMKPNLRNINRNLYELKILKKKMKYLLEIDFTKNVNQETKSYLNICNSITNIHNLIPFIIDYKFWFSKLLPTAEWSPYHLINNLGIKVCPYCNRQFTFTVINKNKSIRPEIDHFLPQHTHPLLALSFFNLIPSCSICNQILKGRLPITYIDYISPYDMSLDNSVMTFDYEPETYEAAVGITNDLKIFVAYTGPKENIKLKHKVENNIKIFHLNEIYQQHTDLASEIIKKRHISDDKYIEILKQTFSHLNLIDSDVYRLGFGNFQNEKEFCNRPMAKFTKDIAIKVRLKHHKVE